MKSPGQHILVRLSADRLLHTSDAQRRALARSVHRTTEPWALMAFGCAGVHMHLSAATDHRGAGELARRLEISLQLKNDYGSPFQRVHRRELRDQRHAFTACLYDMRQRDHHELASDPFLEATSAPDLLGARLIGRRLMRRAVERLPELRRHHLLELYGIEDLRPAEDTGDPLEVAEAALASFALGDFRGKGLETRRARSVVVSLVGPGPSARRLGELLRCAARTIERLRAAPLHTPDEVLAVRIQLDLRRRVRARQQSLLEP
jgi:hypothetical protein